MAGCRSRLIGTLSFILDSELISRNDGSPVGARDLTWSYASFLEAARARERAMGQG
jgi:GH15 family glucan-1,4-alpha-glucosidase